MEKEILRGCGGLIVKYGKVLLFKRKNAKTFNDFWSNPGGSVEEGESVEDAVRRELLEKVGVKVEIVRKLTDYKENLPDNKQGWYTGYLVKVVEGEPKIIEKNKAENLRYF